MVCDCPIHLNEPYFLWWSILTVSWVEFRFIEETHFRACLGENLQRTFFFFITEGIRPTLAPSPCSPVTTKGSSTFFSSVCLLLLLPCPPDVKLQFLWSPNVDSAPAISRQLPGVQQQRYAEVCCFRELSNQQSLWHPRMKPVLAGLSSPYCASQSNQSLLNAYTLDWLRAPKGPFLMHFPIWKKK